MNPNFCYDDYKPTKYEVVARNLQAERNRLAKELSEKNIEIQALKDKLQDLLSKAKSKLLANDVDGAYGAISMALDLFV